MYDLEIGVSVVFLEKKCLEVTSKNFRISSPFFAKAKLARSPTALFFRPPSQGRATLCEADPLVLYHDMAMEVDDGYGVLFLER